MSTDRRLDVLRAIVSDYVATREPVGSRSLVERHNLGVSPATIRNDMAALEDAGYIAQPHTSAGRIPTDTGYRLFVDHLASIKPLTAPERRAIESFLEQSVDLDDAVNRTVRLLAQLTHQVAVVQYPSLRRSALRHVELVPLGGERLLVVMITDSGRVEQRMVAAPATPGPSPVLDEVTVADLRARLNVAAAGLRMPTLRAALTRVAHQVEPSLVPVVDAVADVISETLMEEVEDRIVMAGTANLARSGVDFAQTISPVLEAIEEQVVIMRLLAEMAADGSDDDLQVAVRIGAETKHEGLAETSVVASPYGGETSSDALAFLGVLGPTRMDYPGAMAAVRAVARYLSHVVNS
ncbi:heat-inducible transcriptional repressor HrcA [Serinibacter salmoneus]|uniref:Heat-inducible transcription repressor HrcA n=1 Tax=Serinibacter salmoneus TaxID=556530 RepID=A0A2A9D029_9MICO|nr:heat-inducible transcriptional repressor HrcA [Serinibacter salmoneus]PFG20024.1 heat-inducible transcription repressor HrcA [Serinibacter salmoneus]